MKEINACLKVNFSLQCWLISGVEIWGGGEIKSGGAVALPPSPPGFSAYA